MKVTLPKEQMFIVGSFIVAYRTVPSNYSSLYPYTLALQILYFLDSAQGYVVLAYLIIINLNLVTYVSCITTGTCQ
jgi:hypothetical protein